ncbi:hypothetical protein ACOI22_06480 [Glaciecola sp. 2405UD65-10]|uniref:hypothetical protein n=1 Tax=Glaciecola sp. 2405UD65-10 TaxID=3397244 RepID=UPI003B5B2FBB
MKHIRKTFLSAALFASLITTQASAQEQIVEEGNLVDYKHNGEVYPPVFFVTNIENNSIKEQFSAYKAFEVLDEKAVGLPIGVRILKGHRTKQDGTQFTSLMLSASTLGLIPIVSNTEFKVRYDVFVQGQSIADFEYMMDSTDVNNIWTSAYKNRETKPSEEVFLKDTLSQFLKDIKDHKDVQEVFAEYREFFD